MAGQVIIEPTMASVRREGQALALEMESLKDVKLLNNQLVKFGIRNLERVNTYLERLDIVMKETDDERVVVAGASVAVNALKAVVAAIKAELGTHEQHNHVHLHGGVATMSDDDIRDRLAELGRKARGGGAAT